MPSIVERVRHPGPPYLDRCRGPNCPRLPQRSAGKGLSALYCKVHVNFHARHGSYWRKSFKAVELTPYRSAASRWLQEHRDDAPVALGAAGLDQLLVEAGPAVSAYDLRRMPPAEKAKVALARLREAGVRGSRLLEIVLAVYALADHEGLVNREFIEVQIAKLAHRLASGTHKSTSGFPIPPKYAPSSGKVLRILGHAIWDFAAFAASDSALREVQQLAQPLVPAAKKVEARRQGKLAVKRNTEEAIESVIQRARNRGMGPQSLGELRRQLRFKYGLK